MAAIFQALTLNSKAIFQSQDFVIDIAFLFLKINQLEKDFFFKQEAQKSAEGQRWPFFPLLIA